jgi:hypothetical protein
MKILTDKNVIILRPSLAEDVKAKVKDFFEKSLEVKTVKFESIQVPFLAEYQNVTVHFVWNPKILISVLAFLILSISIYFVKPQTSIPSIKSSIFTLFTMDEGVLPPEKDVLSAFLNEYQTEETETEELEEGVQIDKFQIQKQVLLSKYLIQNKVSRLDQLEDEDLLKLNGQVSDLFVQLVLSKIPMKAHVQNYFLNHKDLNKFETALMEQAKFGVPVSIKLAQSALETAYGKKVINNNYFGIKEAKNQKKKDIITTEYYTETELKRNKSKIISQEEVFVNGRQLYKCKIRDSFATYNSPWKSFRSHSLFLANNNRYAPLFTKGKNYEAWADKIGSSKYGGVGYATSPIYGELLKQIIRKYHLDLLDY